MISKKVGISPKNDNYARLADYIADAGHKGEKSLMHWCAGCLGDDDYQDGIAEAIDVQAMNTRTTKSKTYHLVVSFRPEDEAKLTPDILRDIERRFTQAQGLSEHQRHCAVHTDTQNIHMQIAYNLIHPVTLTRNDHPWDYNKRDALCREIEREYGLTVDNGMEQQRGQRNERAIALEAQQGVQSFDSYVRERTAPILAALDAAKNWQDLHKELHRHGLEIRPKGNGLIIKSRHGKQALKASDVDRRLSKSRLEKVLGEYQPPMPILAKEESRYRSRPVQRCPAGEALYARYQAEAVERKQQADAEKARQAENLTAIREKWRQQRAEVEKSMMLKQNRRNLIQYARKKEAAELAEAKARLHQEQTAPPYESWNDFLRRHADQGDEAALAVLRSRKQSVEVEDSPAPRPPALDCIKAEYAEKQVEVLADTDQSRKGKKTLLAYLRMEEMFKEEGLRGLAVRPEDVTRSVDAKGAVVFTLPGGGKVRDTGKEVLFSGSDELAVKVAQFYARKKWGQRVRMDKGSIVFDVEAEKIQERPRKCLSR